MPTYCTYIYAINPVTNEMCTFMGQNIEAPTPGLAHQWCQNNGLGYLHIGEELVMTIGVKAGTTNEPDWSTKKDYWLEQRN